MPYMPYSPWDCMTSVCLLTVKMTHPILTVEPLPCPCTQVMSDWSFTEKMRGEASTLLERLEAWVEKQNSGMEAAKNPERLQQNFESLLKVMDALYQVGGPWLGAATMCYLCTCQVCWCCAAAAPL
jgi:hypothetical protein